MIKVFLVDDHALVRNCIKAILARDKDVKVVGEAESGESALKGIKETQPDVVVLDILMPGLSCIDVARRLRRLYPRLKLVILTGTNSEVFPKRFIDIGALGYVTKESGIDEVVMAIKKAYQGQRHISAQVAQQLFLVHVEDSSASLFDKLSDRELEILMMIIHGHEVEYIADKLCLSSKTVNSHRYRIFKKLGVENDVELTHFAVKHGLIDVSAPDEIKTDE